MTNKYRRTIRGTDDNGTPAQIEVDVYDVLMAFQTNNPALDHLVKKALCAGQRGHKDLLTDLDDIILSAQRARQIVVSALTFTPVKPTPAWANALQTPPQNDKKDSV